MPHRKLVFGAKAREKVLAGASALADAVRVTLGPKSKSVLIEKAWGKPVVCNDGVAIAKEMDLEDREENLGAQLLREAAERPTMKFPSQAAYLRFLATKTSSHYR